MAQQQPTEAGTGAQKQQQAPDLASEVNAFAAAQIAAALQLSTGRPLGARWAALAVAAAARAAAAMDS